MRAGEILELARRAGIGPGVSVLDLCCGVAGPGRFLTAELGNSYLGVDYSASAIDLARERAGDLPCRFEVSHVPPVPPGPFDVVLLLETMLAFADKEGLVREVSAALRPGGRFAFTVEEGRPLTDAEREAMPDADTVWPVALPDLLACLERVGLEVTWIQECSRHHQAVVESLLAAFVADGRSIAERVGHLALEELLVAHRLWSGWLKDGRVRKFAVVTRRSSGHARRSARHASMNRVGVPPRPCT
ncbi:hypothetical protein GCM10023169_37240 [Georgenia halophila]|uniref:Methyltransferase type 11 domain-containing protein n=2 Tax=Georgenia halophila TaxID=620889 RepID=A0ABP8LLF9_9MICO